MSLEKHWKIFLPLVILGVGAGYVMDDLLGVFNTATKAVSGKSTAAERSAATLTEREGERLALQGILADGLPVKGVVAGDSEMSGDVIACARCHGATLQGKNEGTVMAPAITDLRVQSAAELSKLSQSEVLKRALVHGVGFDGRTLSNVMPRFQVSSSDVNALLGWIAVKDRWREIGVEDQEIRIGVVRDQADNRVSQDLDGTLQNLAHKFSPMPIHGRELRFYWLSRDDLISRQREVSERFFAVFMFELDDRMKESLNSNVTDGRMLLQTFDMPVIAVERRSTDPVGERWFYLRNQIDAWKEAMKSWEGAPLWWGASESPPGHCLKRVWVDQVDSRHLAWLSKTCQKSTAPKELFARLPESANEVSGANKSLGSRDLYLLAGLTHSALSRLGHLPTRAAFSDVLRSREAFTLDHGIDVVFQSGSSPGASVGLNGYFVYRWDQTSGTVASFFHRF